MAKDLIESNAPLSPYVFSAEPVGGDLSILVREATLTAFELMVQLDQVQMVTYILNFKSRDAVLDRDVSVAARLMKLAADNGSMAMVRVLVSMGQRRDDDVVCRSPTDEADHSAAMDSAADAETSVMFDMSLPDVALLAATSLTRFTSEVQYSWVFDLTLILGLREKSPESRFGCALADCSPCSLAC